MKSKPFNISELLPRGDVGPGARAMLLLAQRALKLDVFSRLYSEISGPTSEPGEFAAKALKHLDIKFKFTEAALKRIPRTGPAIVVANHPFGGVEGLGIIDILSKVRPDARLLVNNFLKRIPELRESFLFVDAFAEAGSAEKNIAPLRKALKWLKMGGLLAVFPAGTVSHLQLRRREVSDPQWHENVARLIRLAKVPVVPVFFDGRNSNLFQVAGCIHPLLRTMMLPRELLNKSGEELAVKIATPVPWAKLEEIESDKDLLDYLRVRTYILKHQSDSSRRSLSEAPVAGMQPIVAPQPHAVLEREVRSLPSRQVLIRTNEMLVAYARASQIPALLQEIGRLREVTFRAASEGTGRSIDLDWYDAHYLHLFCWKNQECELVGAYRMGCADSIVRRYGVQGLYTHSLFRYSRSLIEALGPSLELGRSFVRIESQRNYTPLLMLWRGIGRYVAMRPRYKNLFGPVSISSDYESVSRQLLMSFLRANEFSPEFAKFIKPRKLPKYNEMTGKELHTIVRAAKELGDISQLIAEVEEQELGIPVLLRQYLKMGGKLLGFNVDSDFGNVLDGLILVDLTESDSKLLERYLGKDGAERFLAFHNLSQHLPPSQVNKRVA